MLYSYIRLLVETLPIPFTSLVILKAFFYVICRCCVKVSFFFAFASILVCPQFEDYHQWSARREMVVEV